MCPYERLRSFLSHSEQLAAAAALRALVDDWAFDEVTPFVGILPLARSALPVASENLPTPFSDLPLRSVFVLVPSFCPLFPAFALASGSLPPLRRALPDPPAEDTPGRGAVRQPASGKRINVTGQYVYPSSRFFSSPFPLPLTFLASSRSGPPTSFPLFPGLGLLAPRPHPHSHRDRCEATRDACARRAA